MFISVGFISKIPRTVPAYVRLVSSVNIHVIVVSLPLGKSLVTDIAHKRSVRVGCVVCEDVVFHLVFIALLSTVVTGGVDMDLVGVVVQSALALEFHATPRLCALKSLLGVTVGLMIVVSTFSDPFATLLTVNDSIAAC